MDKSLLGHGALALATTLTAYAAWSAPAVNEDDDSVVAIAGAAEQLSAIHWHDESTDVTVARDKDAITVTTQRLTTPPTVPAPAPPPSAPQTYPGSDSAKELFARLAPLRAARNLGVATPERLKSFGLDNPKSKLTLQFAEGSKDLDIGAATYGSGDLYARAADGTVYLLRSSTLASLGHGALSLQDRDLVGVPRAKVERVVISAAGRRREVTQQRGDDATKSFFADPADPYRKLETVTNWVERVLRLRVTDLQNETPSTEPAVVVEFLQDKEALATIRLWPGTTAMAIAQATRFKTPVGVSKVAMDAVMHDLDAVLSEGKKE